MLLALLLLASAQDVEPTARLAGTVSVIAWSGERERPAQGRLRFDVEHVGPQARQRFERQAPVEDGRFELELPVGARVRLREATLDGLGAAPEAALEERVFVAGEELALELRPLHPTPLQVIDGTTEEPIPARIELVELQPERAGWIHPGDLRPSFESRRPLRLAPSRAAPSVFLVRAEGYAWQRVELDPRGADERWVLLERGGVLELEPSPRSGSQRLTLRVRRAEEPERLLLEMRMSSHRPIEGLPPGIYELAAESGAPPQAVLTYGAATAQVVAGERTVVSLPWSDGPTTPLVPVCGTVHVPAEWRLEPPKLELALAGPVAANARERVELELAPVGGAPGNYAFDAGELQPGCYAARVGELPELHVDVPASKNALLRINVPPPAQATVEVVDPATGQPTRVESLRWSSFAAGDTGLPAGHEPTSSRLHPVDFDESSGLYALRAPRGRVFLSVRDPRFVPFEYEPHVLGEPPAHVTLRPTRAMGVLVVLTDGERTVRPQVGTLAPLDPTARSPRSTVYEPDALRLYAAAPGRYRLQVTAPPGYVDPPAVEVEVEREAFTRVELPLVADG